MTAELQPIFLPRILAMQGYATPWRDSTSLDTHVFLDANENPYDALGSEGKHLNYYSEKQDARLVQALADEIGVSTNQLLYSPGSDNAIEILIRATCDVTTGSIVICPPTFGMYKESAHIIGAGVISVPLNATQDYALDVDGILAACRDDTKLIFIPTPNAPMGHAMDPDAIRQLCVARAGKSLVIADEAYIAFSNTPNGMIADLVRYPNLVVMRTLSKSHALAGARVGIMAAHPFAIEQAGKILAPYPVARESVESALRALSPEGRKHTQASIAKLKEGREWLRAELTKLPNIKRVYPSQTNYLVVEFDNADAAFHCLKDKGIVVRPGVSGLANCLRIGVGTPEINAQLIQHLQQMNAVPRADACAL